MILRLGNVVTKTSLGSAIYQIDPDLIISVQPQEIMKNGLHIMDIVAPVGYYGDGSFSNLMRYTLEIEKKDETFEIEFSDIVSRDAALDYIYEEMKIYVPDNKKNKFYKKG